MKSQDTPYFQIVTPCARPENLVKLYESLLPFVKDYDFIWHIVYDRPFGNDIFPDVHWIVQSSHHLENGQAGHSQRNFVLDRIADGFVWQLDDDNLVHPDFFSVLKEAILATKKRAFIFNQIMPDGHLRIPKMSVGYIDNAQFIIHRSLIGSARYDPYDYNADGHLICTLHRSSPNEFEYIPRDICYYNKLRP